MSEEMPKQRLRRLLGRVRETLSDEDFRDADAVIEEMSNEDAAEIVNALDQAEKEYPGLIDQIITAINDPERADEILASIDAPEITDIHLDDVDDI